MDQSEKFLVDGMLGKLCRWMRFMGYDTEYAGSEISDGDIIKKCLHNKRRLITMDIELSDRLEGTLLLRSFKLDDQIRTVLGRFPISAELAMTRCPECNGILEKKSKPTAGFIPAGVRSRFQEYMVCNNCGKTYWKGSHFDRITAKIAKLKGLKDENPS
ncbi:MAG: Mut7-C RNAse domain-containing protein [Thermoplasmataceae archaeon]